VTSILQ